MCNCDIVARCVNQMRLIRIDNRSRDEEKGNKLLLLTFQFYVVVNIYRVFFIEGQIRISCKILKILLFHVGFGLRTEVTMGHLMYDHFQMNF